MDRRSVAGAANLCDRVGVAQHAGYARERLEVIGSRPFGRQQQEHQVYRLVVQRLEIHR